MTVQVIAAPAVQSVQVDESANLNIEYAIAEAPFAKARIRPTYLIDPATGGPIVPASRVPQALVAYRSAITSVDGTGALAASSALFSANPGGAQKCRVYCRFTGTPTTATVRPWVRTGGTAGQCGSGAAQSMNTATFEATFDVQVDGDDLAIALETLVAGTAPAMTVQLSWR